LSALESIKYICPELILLVSSLGILILGLFVKRPRLLGLLSILALAVSLFYLPRGNSMPVPLFSNLLLNDQFSVFFKEVILLVTSIAVLISMGCGKLPQEERGEYYFLLLFAAIAMMLAVSSNNLLMIYIAFEMISLISYILAGFLKYDRFSNEAGLKYFLFGTFATSIMLYGISFIYGLFGSIDLSVISAALAGGKVNNSAVLVSFILVFAGVGFKCALVPLHMWAPDTYEGAPTPVAAFISAGPKAVGFAILIRVFLNNFSPLFLHWAGLFTIISILTMTIGNIAAFSQPNIKRMLGYSSIAQAGYILIGFVAATTLGKTAVLFYLVVYSLMNLGAFGCIVLISRSIKSNSIKDYAGLYKKAPFAAAMLSIFLLSLAGLPPLGGFLGKFLLFSAALESKLILLAVVGGINSILALYYYLRVIKYMYLEEPKVAVISAGSLPLRIALIVTAAGILITGIWPYPFLNWVTSAVR